MELSDFDLCCYLKSIGISAITLNNIGRGRVGFIYEEKDEPLIKDHIDRYNSGRALCDPLALSNARRNLKGWLTTYKEN